MSSSSRSDAEDVEELFQIETRCREMRKEKDMLRQSQSQSLDLVRSLEVYVKSLTEARSEDKKHIQKLEQELMNCSQEIDYLQDQLNARNNEVSFLGEHVNVLESKLGNMQILQELVGELRGELNECNSERLLLMRELEFKEKELRLSVLRIEKLEESISSLALESQCEIESMRLDMMGLEQTCFEAGKNQEESILLDELVENLEVQFQDPQETIRYLEKENTELREKLFCTETSAKSHCQNIKKWLENKNGSQLDVQHLSELVWSKNLLSKETSEDVELLISELSLAPAPEADVVEKMESMSSQICDYEVVIKRLKEELREEKLKAKEEAEDLAQEMAELRYQLTSLLEEECKRRSCIEQASLQRIAELEAQIQKEPKKPLAVVRHLNGA